MNINLNHTLSLNNTLIKIFQKGIKNIFSFAKKIEGLLKLNLKKKFGQPTTKRLKNLYLAFITEHSNNTNST